jgi:hypothetical protein
VRTQIPETPGRVPTKPTKAPSVGFVGVLGSVFQKNQALEATAAKPAQTLEEHIRFARNKAELGRLAKEVQTEFEAGHLSQAQSDRLTWLVMCTAQQLRAGLVNVPASAFLRDDDDTTHT